jgi:hypothetical protein
MTQKQFVKCVLLWGLVVISLGGWLLHLRVHPIVVSKANLIPFLTGVISIVAIPLLFLHKKTFHYAYVLNGMFVIIGTITMAHFSIAHHPPQITLKNIFLNTTLADIMLLWAKFAIGKAIFDLEILSNIDQKHGGTSWHYPNMLWWWIHFAGFSVVYALGNILWK